MKRGCTQCGDCLDVCLIFALYRREEYSPKGKRLLMEPLDGWGAGETPLPTALPFNFLVASTIDSLLNY